MRVVVEGCCHGELDKIYHTIEEIEQVIHDKIDLLLICGDFQAVRNQSDLASLACPLKYRKMQSFYKYYNGTIEAPLLTIFIGGNHEASNHLQELYFGGWVAHNIYYLGSAGVINVNGLRIAGLSGIYNSKHYHLGHYEIPPYDSDELRSVYHVRAFEVWKLKQLSGRIDIVLTHDWPRGIHYHGDAKKLLRKKSFLTQELLSNTLGSPPNEELLNCLQPAYWFSSHMHVKFPAIVKHQHPKDESILETKFLSLDKCLPQRDFLQVIDFPQQPKGLQKFAYDQEWLAITKLSHRYFSTARSLVPLPEKLDREEIEKIRDLYKESKDLQIPHNFVITEGKYDPLHPDSPIQKPLKENPQTTALLELLQISGPIYNYHKERETSKDLPKEKYANPDEIQLESD